MVPLEDGILYVCAIYYGKDYGAFHCYVRFPQGKQPCKETDSPKTLLML